MSEEALRLKESGATNDYILNEGHGSVWIEIGNLAVYIVRADEGVAVDIYPNGREADDPLTSTWALFSEAEVDEEEL